MQLLVSNSAFNQLQQTNRDDDAEGSVGNYLICGGSGARTSTFVVVTMVVVVL